MQPSHKQRQAGMDVSHQHEHRNQLSATHCMSVSVSKPIDKLTRLKISLSACSWGIQMHVASMVPVEDIASPVQG